MTAILTGGDDGCFSLISDSIIIELTDEDDIPLDTSEFKARGYYTDLMEKCNLAESPKMDIGNFKGEYKYDKVRALAKALMRFHNGFDDHNNRKNLEYFLAQSNQIFGRKWEVESFKSNDFRLIRNILNVDEEEYSNCLKYITYDSNSASTIIDALLFPIPVKVIIVDYDRAYEIQESSSQRCLNLAKNNFTDEETVLGLYRVNNSYFYLTFPACIEFFGTVRYKSSPDAQNADPEDEMGEIIEESEEEKGDDEIKVQIKVDTSQIKEEIVEEIKEDMQKIKKEIKDVIKEELLEMKEQIKEVKKDIGVYIKEAKEESKMRIKEVKKEIKVCIKEVKEDFHEVEEEIKHIREEIKGLKEIKDDTEQEIQKVKKEILEIKAVQEKVKEAINEDIEGAKDEIKAGIKEANQEIKETIEKVKDQREVTLHLQTRVIPFEGYDPTLDFDDSFQLISILNLHIGESMNDSCGGYTDSSCAQTLPLFSHLEKGADVTVVGSVPNSQEESSPTSQEENNDKNTNQLSSEYNLHSEESSDSSPIPLLSHESDEDPSTGHPSPSVEIQSTDQPLSFESDHQIAVHSELDEETEEYSSSEFSYSSSIVLSTIDRVIESVKRPVNFNIPEVFHQQIDTTQSPDLYHTQEQSNDFNFNTPEVFLQQIEDVVLIPPSEKLVYDSGADQQRLRTKNVLVRELVDNEEAFAEQMGLLINIYHEKLKYEEFQGCISEANMKRLFSNVDQMFLLSQKLVLHLKASINSYVFVTRFDSPDRSLSNVETKVGTAILEFIPLIESTFGSYFASNRLQMHIYDELKSSDNPMIDIWLSECLEESRKETIPWDLRSLLMKPIKRLDQYPLVFGLLLESTDRGDPDYGPIKVALERLEECVARINFNVYGCELGSESSSRALGQASSYYKRPLRHFKKPNFDLSRIKEKVSRSG